MSNELRDPHDPVIPGKHKHPAGGHGGVSMPIGVSGDRTDPHEPVLPERMKQNIPSAADLDAVEAEKQIADSGSQAEAFEADLSSES